MHRYGGRPAPGRNADSKVRAGPAGGRHCGRLAERAGVPADHVLRRPGLRKTLPAAPGIMENNKNPLVASGFYVIPER